jgi:hypothetical protein
VLACVTFDATATTIPLSRRSDITLPPAHEREWPAQRQPHNEVVVLGGLESLTESTDGGERRSAHAGTA